MRVLVAVYGSAGGELSGSLTVVVGQKGAVGKMRPPVSQGWAGIDVGMGHHWVCLIDETGTTLWSAKVLNDEKAILEAIAPVLARAQQVTGAVDVTGTMSGLLLALLAAHDQRVKYVRNLPNRVRPAPAIVAYSMMTLLID